MRSDRDTRWHHVDWAHFKVYSVNRDWMCYHSFGVDMVIHAGWYRMVHQLKYLLIICSEERKSSPAHRESDLMT